MSFGERLRGLRLAKGFTLRRLASLVGVGFTYLSRVETATMTSGDYPSAALIHKLSVVLDADEDELLILAEKIPDKIRQRVLERPDVFRKLADLPDEELTLVSNAIATRSARRRRR